MKTIFHKIVTQRVDKMSMFLYFSFSFNSSMKDATFKRNRYLSAFLCCLGISQTIKQDWKTHPWQKGEIQPPLHMKANKAVFILKSCHFTPSHLQ